MSAEFPWESWFHREHHDLCKVEARNYVLTLRIKELGQELRWVGQTVHQAHHKGAMADCSKSTCAAIRKALGEEK